MDIINTILLAAKAVGVSGQLLIAICAHESLNFQYNYTPYDKGSPSYGICQIKYDSAYQMGFRGLPYELNSPQASSYWAARYLKYQQKRYGDDWVKIAASYNSGSYFPSNKNLGGPKNLKYVKLVQRKLPEDFKDRLSCGNREIAENGEN
jgi:soluble lytic murein transglycosylase-like protein